MVEASPIKNKRDFQMKHKVNSNGDASKEGFSIGWIEKSYLVGIVIVELWGQFFHHLILGDKLPFIPLMLISIYCAIGVIYSWIWQLMSITRSADF